MNKMLKLSYMKQCGAMLLALAKHMNRKLEQTLKSMFHAKQLSSSEDTRVALPGQWSCVWRNIFTKVEKRENEGKGSERLKLQHIHIRGKLSHLLSLSQKFSPIKEDVFIKS